MTRYSPIIDWSLIRASAPGRFILMGEYAEFFNKNAIAMTINRRCKVTIKNHKEGKLRLNLKNYNNIREWPTTSFSMTKLVAKYADILEYTDTIPNILNHLLHKRYYIQDEFIDNNVTNDNNDIDNKSNNTSSQNNNDNTNNNTNLIRSCKNSPDLSQQADNATMAFLILYISLADSYAWSSRPSLSVEVESDIPIGRGLGSSTSFAVAICAALMKVFRVSAEPYVVSDWTLNIEKFFHGGMSSGLNTNVIVHGGYVYYQSKIKSYGVPHLTQIKVMFIDSNNYSNTKEVNSIVAKMLLEQPNRINSVLTTVHDLVSVCWRKINDPQFTPKSITAQLSFNQLQLDSLDLGSSNITEICNKANLDRLTVKQTQKGDLVFLLFDESDNRRHLNDFRLSLAEDGYSSEIFDISYKGLDVEVSY